MRDLPLKVTAHLAGSLAGEPPQLDALVEWALTRSSPSGSWGDLAREYPLPRLGESQEQYLRRFLERYPDSPDRARWLWQQYHEGRSLPGPLTRSPLAGWQVAHCSSAILGSSLQAVEHVCKRLGTEHALLLAEKARVTVDTTNSWTKSYRIPLRIRRVPRVVWFARGDRSVLLEVLSGIQSIGKKISYGYGVVSGWSVEEIAEDYSWYAPSPGGTVLMRTFPDCPELPGDLVGYRRGFGACCPPYWHPDRHTPLVEPVA